MMRSRPRPTTATTRRPSCPLPRRHRSFSVRRLTRSNSYIGDTENPCYRSKFSEMRNYSLASPAIYFQLAAFAVIRPIFDEQMKIFPAQTVVSE